MAEIPRTPRTKICGLTRIDDAGLAGRAGADFVGAILSPGYGRSVQPETAARFAEVSGRPLVAVTVDADVADLIEVAGRSGASVLQLHGDEPVERLAELRDAGDWELWKALRVRTADEVRAALDRFGEAADGLVLDGWHPEHRGGSGIRFPWDLVEPLRREFPAGLRFISAGGLQPDNVAEAVQRLSPDVVDVSSGVEIEHGIKDPARVRAFIRNATRDHPS
ncbi:MAG: phosphoribosylanthranilate isomerase [Gemmatimonadetes bacterium]|nr:phosphoribosylanthranilate isomerase [Gemmatimonadota bacterium]